MKNKITVIGSLNYDVILKVDRLPYKGETMAVDNSTFSAGGKGANQAVQTAKLKTPTYMVGCVGTDASADFLVCTAKQYGVDTRFIRKVEGSSGMGIIHALEDGSVYASIVRGANFQIKKEDIDKAMPALKESKVCILQNEIPVPMIEYGIDKAKEAGCIVVLNGAPAIELPDEYLAKVDILVVNEVEASFYCKETVDSVDKAKEAGYGGIITYQSAYAFYSFFYQNECPVIDTSGDIPQVVIDNKEGKEAWNYICDLISKGGLVESFKEATTWDKVYESFANGEATFLLGGDWCSSGVENINPDLDYGIAPMVKGKTEATVLGGWTWNINTNCKNPELAYDLIQYLNSEKGDSLLGVEGKISARKDFDYDKALEGNDKLKVFTEEFPYTEARPAVINEKSIDELITNAILEVDYGQSSAEDALTSLTQKLNENIASNYQ